MKDNIEYYRHYANSHNHHKFKMLRVEFGWAGEGRFWALNNLIASATDCWLDLKKKYIKASVASDLGFSLSELDHFIGFLFEDCELILCEDGRISTKEVQENYSEVLKKRAAARERKKGKGAGSQELSDSSGEPSARSPEPVAETSEPGTNETTKQSKGKKSKEKQTISFDGFWEAYGKGPGKAHAKKAFDKLSEEDRQIAMDAIPRYLAYLARPENSWLKKKHASTWLNQRCFEDDSDDLGGSSSDPVIPPEIRIPVVRFGRNEMRKYSYGANTGDEIQDAYLHMPVFLDYDMGTLDHRRQKEPPLEVYQDLYRLCVAKLNQKDGQN